MRKTRIITLAIIISMIISSCDSMAWAKDLLKNKLKDKRPNFLIILTDDQRYDTLQYMPQTRQKIFDQGVTFDHGYITTPLCCPSRVSLLTGKLAQNTKVRTNGMVNTNRTFIEDFQKNGYYTGLVGKYLNYWKGDARPEFDYWVSFFKGETPYFDPALNVNGVWREHIGYITDILGTYSITFVEDAIAQRKPWVLLYAPIAPHEPADPDYQDLDLYPYLEPHRPPSFNEEDISDKPDWFGKKALLTDDEIAKIDAFRKEQILTLTSLDRAIGKLIDRLEDKGALDNTVIIFLSDNGKFWGEHRISSKNSFYEEAVKVPFGLRYPPLVTEPYIESRLVANIDIAPTLYELANIKPPADMDGMSLVPLLTGSNNWRENLLIEGWPPRGIFAALHTGRYVYAETIDDKSELYDLENDPYQLMNLAYDPAYADMVKDFHEKLLLVKEPEGVPTPIPE